MFITFQFQFVSCGLFILEPKKFEKIEKPEKNNKT